nr:MAG TPA: hypothetical protein [Caudoviricetes sp.]
MKSSGIQANNYDFNKIVIILNWTKNTEKYTILDL